MSEYLFHLSRDSGRGLQAELREHLVKAILDGHIPAGHPVPSSRYLAQQLSVARNTVVLAYQQLVDEGYLISRERSGYFVNEDILAGRVGQSVQARRPPASDKVPNWARRWRRRPSAQRNIKKPRNWQRFQYPFIYGQLDPALFPIADWRECCREALSVRAIHDWVQDRVDEDDPGLIEEVRARVLPRRGVWAEPSEVLVTLGAQQALYLIAALLMREGTTVGMEDPGYPDARNIFSMNGANIQAMPIDGSGMQMREELDGCEYVFVTPSHQFPTTVTLPLDRRKTLLRRAVQDDIVIIEDDYEAETNYADRPTPALKSLDRDGRVIYVGSLSKTLAPGLRLGFLVGTPDFIREARALRRLMLRHPPANNQHAVSMFLARGHHDSLVRRLSHAYKERWCAMREALASHLPKSARTPTFGGTAFWVQGRNGLDTQKLADEAANIGILIEPGAVFFAAPTMPCNYFRLGFSAVPVDRIEPGIAKLAALIAKL